MTDSATSPPVKGWGDRLYEVLKHPLALLLISSVLLPSAVYLYNQRRQQAEARQKQALDIIEKNSVFEGKLYALYQDFIFFHQANKRAKPEREQLDKTRREFANVWSARYSEFRKGYPEGSLWVNELFIHGSLLRLYPAGELNKLGASDESPNVRLSEGLQRLKEHVYEYEGNVGESLAVFGALQKLLDSDAYEFSDGGPTETRIAGDEITGEFNRLRDERTRLVRSLVADFNR